MSRAELYADAFMSMSIYTLIEGFNRETSLLSRAMLLLVLLNWFGFGIFIGTGFCLGFVSGLDKTYLVYD